MMTKVLVGCSALALASYAAVVPRNGSDVAVAFGLVQGEPVHLAPNVPVERELTAGETHSYELTLAAGQYAHAIADQLGIDVELTVSTPDGRTFPSIENTAGGPEPVFILADTGGAYRLAVRSTDPKAPAGRYRLRVDELRSTRADDRTRMEAQALFGDARRLERQRTPEARRQSLEQYQEALARWRAVGDRLDEALTLNRIGALGGTTKPELGIEQLEQALLWQELGDLHGRAQTLADMGAMYGAVGDTHRSLDYLSQALPLVKQLGSRGGEIMTLANIGIAHANLGEYRDALDRYEQALEISRAVGDRYGEAFSLHGMGFAHAFLGENHTALEQLHHALDITRDIGNRSLPPTILSMLGRIYLRLGDTQRALQSYEESLRLSREAGNVAAEANTLRGIGLVHRTMGDPQKALEYLNQALAIARTTQRGLVESSIETDLGGVLADLGDREQALGHYARASELHQKNGTAAGEVIVLSQTGLLYEQSGEPDKASASFDKALALSEAIRYAPGKAMALWGRASLDRGRGRLVEARDTLERALSLVESTRIDLDSQDLRVSFAASARKYYDLYIDVLMQLHEPAAALESSERARARGLLESLVEAHADIRQGADPALLEREHALQQRINAVEARRLQVRSRPDRSARGDEIEAELAALLAEHEDVQTRIRTTSPRFAALMYPRSLSLKEIQQQTLDDHTLLLEYALGEDRSYLWAVTTTSVEGFELPRRADIEAAATRAFALVRAAPARESQRQTELALARLSRMLLGSVAGRIEGKRLAIVADGALQYLPFDALPAPGGAPRGRGSADPQPLIVDHEVVSLPSASALAVLRQDVAGRGPALHAVAVFSDPVFEPDDPRVQRPHNLSARRPGMPAAASAHGANGEDQRPEGTAALTRSAVESGVVRFERLRFSRLEAESIARLAGEGGVLRAVDFRASKTAATGADLAQYRIVHLATHGLLNSEHPELSGIVLSLVDEQGRPQDGFLRAHEIYDLRLGADLVVLSACQTALGKDIRGEGLVGLTRGFMYAGAPRVVASLWDVKDEATAELMKRFYTRMLVDHLRPAAALRAAQVSMWQAPRWRAPYYWAAFVLQGEWR